MNFEIKHKFETSDVKEFFMEYNRKPYLIIYGKHINGGFIALPGCGKSCEAGEPGDVAYNAESLNACGFSKGAAKAIACAIWDFHKRRCTV